MFGLSSVTSGSAVQPQAPATSPSAVEPAREKRSEEAPVPVGKLVPMKGSQFDFPIVGITRKIIDNESIDGKSYMTDFLQRTDIPEQLKAFVGTYIGKHKCKQGKIDCLDYPVIALLSNEAMKAHLMEYQTKYGIHIEMCNGVDLANTLQQLKDNPPSSSPFGLIVQSEYEEGHATPLLCHFTLDTQQVVIMDALGSNSTWETVKQSKSACLNARIGYREAFKPRQADGFSCRTSAVILLRNALLDIMNKQNTQSFTAIFAMTQPVEDQGEGSICVIPREWDYTDQITNQAKAADEAYVPRQHIRGKPPMTVTEFRERHTNAVMFEYQLELDYMDSDPSALATLTYPPGVEVRISNAKTLILSWRGTRRINTYLVYKGQRNAIQELGNKA